MSARRAITIGTAAGLLALGIAAPVVHAAKPSTPLPPTPLSLPAGLGCAFDVELEPDSTSRATLTEFGDGRILITSNGESTVTNLDDPTRSVRVRDRGTLLQTYDADANDVFIEAQGQTIFYFYPGDQGPLGTVGPNGGLFHVTGHVREMWDLDNDVITSFSSSGQATDLCALISD